VRRRRSQQVRVGCSGWQYKHWKGDFYPADLPADRWLAHYTRVFDTVEINNSFYRLPEIAAVRGWADRAPRGFRFAWKGSRYLTHMRKLKDPADPLARLYSRARLLGIKLGPVLFQLPPRWAPNLERLEAFVGALAPDVQHAIEFREAAWYSSEVFRILERGRVALCLHDMPGSAVRRQVVGPFVYVRFHGATGRYRGNYPDAQLAEWAEWLAERAAERLDIYAYFNNDVHGHAPRNASTLRDMVLGRIHEVQRS
jgi:uncharacterized protein YecE (DUF72 family)